MSLETPVLLMIFNRPEVTSRVFEEIRKQKPTRLLISADAPRNSEEEEKCSLVKQIVEKIDWPCEVSRDYADKNLGCKRRVSSAITWAFSLVDSLIILEDDCLPSPEFFSFCGEMLEKYEDNNRIMMISGDNFQNGQKRGDASYYFSKYSQVWGWATWKRAWDLYDVDLRDWPERKKSKWMKEKFTDKKERDYWIEKWDAVHAEVIDTWDFQWGYTVMANDGLSIMPNENLISNIGFGPDATHTLVRSPYAELPLGRLGSITHPDRIEPSKEADDFTFKHVFAPDSAPKKSLLRRAKDKLKRTIRECL